MLSERKMPTQNYQKLAACFFMIIFVNILKINVSKKQRNQKQNQNEQEIILLYSYMTIHIKAPNLLFIFIILSSSIENKY